MLIIVGVIAAVIVTLLAANQLFTRRAQARRHPGYGEDAAEMTEEMRDTAAGEFGRTTGEYRRWL
jgi:hypothetical protein